MSINIQTKNYRLTKNKPSKFRIIMEPTSSEIVEVSCIYDGWNRNRRDADKIFSLKDRAIEIRCSGPIRATKLRSNTLMSLLSGILSFCL